MGIFLKDFPLSFPSQIYSKITYEYSRFGKLPQMPDIHKQCHTNLRRTSPMRIGNVEISGYAALAPMAGVADQAFRELCREFGACYVVGEMASSKGLTMQGRKTEELLAVTEDQRPMGVQLFGDDPLTMAKAAERCMDFSPDIIDINMGCPAPKVAAGGGGSALMKNPDLAGKIVKAVAGAVPVPVTVKIRKGWDDSAVNAVEMAKILEQNGAAALTVHGRTRQQMYAGTADREIIRLVKQAVSVPVIANGDVVDGPSAKAMYDETGADMVMVGRGSCGAPWVFAQIDAYMQNGIVIEPPTLTDRLGIMLTHIHRLCQIKGERVGMKEARKHCSWYIKGLKGAAAFRREVAGIAELKDLDFIVDAVITKAAIG